MAGENLEELRNLVGAGHDIPAGNLSGMRSGLSKDGRELTASEGLWQQRNAEAHADYNQRKADRETRRALNVDPRRSGAATSLASIYKDRAQTYRDSAKNLMEARAGSAASAIRNRLDTVGYGDDPVKKGRIAYASIDGGATPRNDLAAPAPPDQPQDALSALAQQSAAPEPNVGGPFAALYEKAMAAVKGALKAPSGAPYGDGLSQLASSLGGAASEPAASAPTASPQMPPLKMVASGGMSMPAYEYGGNTILLGDGIDANDASAVQDYMNNTNRIIDMMNAAYA